MHWYLLPWLAVRQWLVDQAITWAESWSARNGLNANNVHLLPQAKPHAAPPQAKQPALLRSQSLGKIKRSERGR